MNRTLNARVAKEAAEFYAELVEWLANNPDVDITTSEGQETVEEGLGIDNSETAEPGPMIDWNHNMAGAWDWTNDHDEDSNSITVTIPF